MNTDTKNNPGPLSALIWSLAASVAIVLLDQTIKDVTITPALGICAMFILALKFRPSSLLLCMLPLVAVVSWNLAGIHLWGPTPEVGRFWVRLLVFVLACLIAVVAGHYRSRLDAIRRQLTNVFQALPIPLLVIDHSGRIQACSQTTCELAEMRLSDIVGRPIVQVAGSQLVEETEEDWFRHWIDSPPGVVFDSLMQIGRLRSEVRVARLGAGRHSVMLIVFDRHLNP